MKNIVTENGLVTLSYNRMETDTDRSFEAFILYRDMGLKRSCAKVAELLGKTPQMITNWSADHHWVKRVALWDAEIDRRKTRAELFDIEAAKIRHLRMMRTQQKLAAKELAKHLKRSENLPDDAPAIDADKAAKVQTEAIKIERLIQGEPTDRTESVGFDWNKLDVEEIEIFKALLIKVTKRKDEGDQ